MRRPVAVCRVIVPQNYAAMLLGLRRRLGLNQGQFADRIGAASKAVVYQWESRKRKPSPVFWLRIERLQRTFFASGRLRSDRVLQRVCSKAQLTWKTCRSRIVITRLECRRSLCDSPREWHRVPVITALRALPRATDLSQVGGVADNPVQARHREHQATAPRYDDRCHRVSTCLDPGRPLLSWGDRNGRA